VHNVKKQLVMDYRCESGFYLTQHSQEICRASDTEPDLLHERRLTVSCRWWRVPRVPSLNTVKQF